MALVKKSIILIDGENITTRYEKTLEEKKGQIKAKENVQYEYYEVREEGKKKRKGYFLWTPDLLKFGTDQESKYLINPLRISFYTIIVGAQEFIDDAELKMSTVGFECCPEDGIITTGTLNPHIYKKHKNGIKTKSVDINIVVDALKHTYNKTIEKLYLLSGDGDYIPLIKEVMSQGIETTVCSFASGLSPRLRTIADDFYLLDDYFFEEVPPTPSPDEGK